jgi:hypothetical protein
VVLVVGRSAAQISFGGDEEVTPPPDNSCSTPFQKVSLKGDPLTKKDYYENNWKRLCSDMCDLFFIGLPIGTDFYVCSMFIGTIQLSKNKMNTCQTVFCCVIKKGCRRDTPVLCARTKESMTNFSNVCKIYKIK